MSFTIDNDHDDTGEERKNENEKFIESITKDENNICYLDSEKKILFLIPPYYQGLIKNVFVQLRYHDEITSIKQMIIKVIKKFEKTSYECVLGMYRNLLEEMNYNVQKAGEENDTIKEIISRIRKKPS